MATSRWRTNGHQQGDLMAAAGEIQMAIDSPFTPRRIEPDRGPADATHRSRTGREGDPSRPEALQEPGHARSGLWPWTARRGAFSCAHAIG
jgi:hypothetical protein